MNISTMITITISKKTVQIYLVEINLEVFQDCEQQNSDLSRIFTDFFLSDEIGSKVFILK